VLTEPTPDTARVCAVLTAYNEADNIPSIIDDIRRRGHDVLVVDDGSIDGTESVARFHGAYVVRHMLNLGQGFSLLTGFKAVLHGPYDIIIEMDADGQHSADEIHKFVTVIIQEALDLVVGSRIRGGNYSDAPWLRKTFLPLFTAMVNRASGYALTDAMCGFRAFRRTSLVSAERELDNILEGQYFAAEMFIRLARCRFSIAEIPIQLNQRSSGKSRKGLLRYGFGVIKAIVRALGVRDVR